MPQKGVIHHAAVVHWLIAVERLLHGVWQMISHLPKNNTKSFLSIKAETPWGQTLRGKTLTPQDK